MPDAYDAIAEVIEERFALIDAKQAEKARDATRSPASQLGHLAWSRGLDYWDKTWSEDQKRAIIEATPANLRRRGTIASIESALDALVNEVTLVEWFDMTPEGEPCTGECLVSDGSYVETSQNAIYTLVRVLRRESRRAMHWQVIVGVTSSPAIGDEGYGRAGALYQYSGVQEGA